MNSEVEYSYIFDKGLGYYAPEQIENDYLLRAQKATEDGKIVSLPTLKNMPAYVETSDVLKANGTTYVKNYISDSSERGTTYEMCSYSFEDEGFTLVEERKYYEGNEVINSKTSGFSINSDGQVCPLIPCVAKNVFTTVEEIFDFAQHNTANLTPAEQ